jgi:hypothetical protein
LPSFLVILDNAPMTWLNVTNIAPIAADNLGQDSLGSAYLVLSALIVNQACKDISAVPPGSTHHPLGGAGLLPARARMH